MIKDGLHGTISEIKTQYITIPGTVVLSCQYENDPALGGGKEGSSYPRIQQLIRLLMEVKGLEPPTNY
jgi:hypothetical protein